VRNYDKKWKAKIGKGIKRGMMLNGLLSSGDRSLNVLISAGRIGSRILTRVDMDLINYFT